MINIREDYAIDKALITCTIKDIKNGTIIVELDEDYILYSKAIKHLGNPALNKGELDDWECVMADSLFK